MLDQAHVVTMSDPPVARIDLIVVRGTAERKTYSFAARRIDLGRCAEVRDTRNRLIRTNHVAFVEGSGEVNQSVSRRHAHLAYEPASGGYRLRDDGSVHGTSVVRNGSTFTGYTSPDGVTWTTHTGQTATVTMTGTFYVGFAQCSGSNTTLDTTTFDNVSITSP